MTCSNRLLTTLQKILFPGTCGLCWLYFMFGSHPFIAFVALNNLTGLDSISPSKKGKHDVIITEAWKSGFSKRMHPVENACPFKICFEKQIEWPDTNLSPGSSIVGPMASEFELEGCLWKNFLLWLMIIELWTSRERWCKAFRTETGTVVLHLCGWLNGSQPW